MLADDLELALWLTSNEHGNVDAEDDLERRVAEVRVRELTAVHPHNAGLYRGRIPILRCRNHFRRAVDGVDGAVGQLLRHQRYSDAVSTADLENPIGRPDRESVDSPDDSLRCGRRHYELPPIRAPKSSGIPNGSSRSNCNASARLVVAWCANNDL